MVVFPYWVKTRAVIQITVLLYKDRVICVDYMAAESKTTVCADDRLSWLLSRIHHEILQLCRVLLSVMKRQRVHKWQYLLWSAFGISPRSRRRDFMQNYVPNWTSILPDKIILTTTYKYTSILISVRHLA